MRRWLGADRSVPVRSARENSSLFFGLLVPNRALRATENPRVDGSIPSLATISNLSVPVTWVTDYSDDMGNASAPNGFSALSRSKNGNLVLVTFASAQWVTFISAPTPQLLRR